MLRTSSDEAEKGFYRCAAQTILETTLHMSSVEVSDDSSIAALRPFYRRRCVRRLMKLKKDFTDVLLGQYWRRHYICRLLRFQMTVRSLRLDHFTGDVA